jgi:putative hydrolase of HD superfamily
MNDSAASGNRGERLEEQIRFILEIDRLKSVLRQTLVMDGTRRENSAEHSWHLAVEIDAGDTFCYDEQANHDREERERRAADRLFEILPADQASEVHALWEEFEDRETPEARFATALDRMQPMLANLATEGHSWRSHGVVRAQVVKRTSPIGQASSVLWDYMLARLDEAVASGYLKES